MSFHLPNRLGRALLLLALALPVMSLAEERGKEPSRSSNSSEARRAQVVARKAFEAWGVGERTGDYSAFLALLGPEFKLFSHPQLPRVFRGPEAVETLRGLIALRTATPNNLTFSNVEVSVRDGASVFQFDSQGTVLGGAFPYQGWNAIAFSVEAGQLTGFREYFGFVDPAWYQSR